MPLVTLYRDGEVAFVETDYQNTYENFLAHGWAHEIAKLEPAETSAPLDDQALPKKPTAKPGRKPQ